jgi:hypothetical protein
MAPEKRLAIFDHIARSQYPDAIVQLVTAPSEAQDSLSDRDLECQHESPENMELIAQELPLVLRAFTKLYGTPVREVQGLCASTVEATAQVIEPFLGRALV